MDRVNILYEKLEKREPFCFLKLNDGECAIMKNPDPSVIASRGDQASSEALSQKMKECLTFQHPDYYVGLPCNRCYSGQFRDTLNTVLENKRDIDKDPNFMNANILINSNTLRTLECLKQTLTNRNLVIVTNSTMAANLSKLEQFLTNRCHHMFLVPSQNAFESSYSLVGNKWEHIPDNSVVLCMCGPLGRVLCYEWFKANPTLTCLELGSLFDPILKNRSYSYHQNTLPLCSECNPTRLSERAFCKEVPDETHMHTECFYFHDISGYVSFYHHDYATIRRVLWYRFKHELENPLYHRWLAELDEYPAKVWIDEFKRMTRSQMVTHLWHVYNCKEYEKLKCLTKIYIDYFSDMKDADLRKIKFYLAFGYTCTHVKDKAMTLFEELLRDPNLEDQLKHFVVLNLNNLYPKNTFPIPKIIHIIYFKVRDLEEYNYRCIASMAHHMPNYKIIIHNDIEPIGNQWWDKIKTIKSVELHHMNRPSHFDGFALHHVQYQADVTRLEVLYEQGGIYLDLDILVLKNFEKLFESNRDFYISYEGPLGEDGKGGLINSFLASKPKNEFIKHWLEGFKSGLRMENWAYHIRDTNRIMLENNPHFMHKYRIEILDHKSFFPLLWTDYDAFYNRRKVEFGEDSYGVHLFDTIHHAVLVKNEFLPDVSKYREDYTVVDVKNIFTIGFRCNADEFLTDYMKIRKYSSPFSYMVIDLETALHFIDTKFENYTNLDHITGPRDIKFNNNIWGYKNSHKIADIPGDCTDVLHAQRVCLWNHHDLNDSKIIESLNRRSRHLVSVLNNQPETLLMFYVEKTQYYKGSRSYFDIEKLKKYNCNFLVFVPLVDFKSDPELVFDNNKIRVIYFSSNCNGWSSDINSHPDQWNKLKSLVLKLYNFAIEDRAETI